MAHLRLMIVADWEPSSLQQVLIRFQNLNTMPHRLLAELAAPETMHIEVDLLDLAEERLQLIASKIEQSPCIHRVRWTYV